MIYIDLDLTQLHIQLCVFFFLQQDIKFHLSGLKVWIFKGAEEKQVSFLFNRYYPLFTARNQDHGNDLAKGLVESKPLQVK